MAVKVIMPQLGESVVEGTVTKWLKAVGEPVAENEPLLEVNTDKVDTEVPSPTSGIVLDILVKEGTLVHAGEALAVIGAAGEESSAVTQDVPAESAPPPSPAQPAAVSLQPAAPAASRDRNLGFISPVVAKIASEQEVDLFQVPGTGQGGRITKNDVLKFIEERPAAGAGSVRPPEPRPQTEERPKPAAVHSLQGDEILPMTNVRRAIAEHMVMSERTSPHVTTVMEVDMSRVTAHRAANKDTFARDGVNLTFTAYFIAATVAALKAYPIVNSSWSDQGIILHRAINIGMATSLGDEGLIVPIIKHADGLSLLGVAHNINDLANRARSHKLSPDEVRGGTFTITNHGTTGSLFATPIINQPQCAILGVGVIQKRVVVINDAIAIRPMVYLSLTFDHRILDGAIADNFLGKVVESLANWS